MSYSIHLVLVDKILQQTCQTQVTLHLLDKAKGGKCSEVTAFLVLKPSHLEMRDFETPRLPQFENHKSAHLHI